MYSLDNKINVIGGLLELIDSYEPVSEHRSSRQPHVCVSQIGSHGPPPEKARSVFCI